MNIIKPEDIMNSSFKTEEYLPDNPSHSGDDGLNMINQLANELYREGLAGYSSSLHCSPCTQATEVMEQFVAEKTEFKEQARPAPHSSKLYPLPSIPKDTQQLMTSMNKIDFPADYGDSAYYFLPGFQSAPYTKQMSSRYYKPGLDVYSIRKDFPILQRRINGKPLVWLDNAATTQKPLCMMNALNRYYSEYNSNIHRGAHTLAKLATNAYEAAREKVRNFIGAPSTEEIIFVRGATEAINLVAESFGGMNIHKGDEIVLTMMEHHSNIVPWQKLQQAKGAVIKVMPINDRGEVILDEYEKLLTPRTRLVSITHMSNVLGTVNPVCKMIEMAHKQGAVVLIDGAQSVPHIGVDVKELDADFYAFSGHKVYGPTGIGVLYGKKALLEEMPPWQRGGGMIKNVSFKETTYNSLPYKFEAGTGNIADAVGLAAAIDYIQEIGMDNIERHEKELTVYAMEKLYQIPGLHIIGTAPDKTSVIAFVIDGVSPDNAAKYLNQDGIAVRSGHHCAQPALHRYGLTSSIRAAFGVYNTKEEVECLVNSVLKIAKYYN
ncbi:MAG: cysteine desulfurase [Clostridia bacterium]|nr:cysteine desulfurase [Clostridia bacterium]